MLRGKHILVGISGGIAAYKIPELIRQLRKSGAEVKVTTTKNALEFVTELTLQTLSGAKVYSDVFAAINEHSTEHISLPDWADLMVIAPATANVMAKIAAGIADDALTTTFCAMRKPVVIAPAMNDKMYQNQSVQDAVETLSRRNNITLLDCEEGELACGTNGKGRMQEIDAILEAIRYALTPKTMAGKCVLINSGPTQEAIDPVRFISNHSTGKMGMALAYAAWYRGAVVKMVSGPVNKLPKVPAFFNKKPALEIYPVTTAAQMAQVVQEIFPMADAAILCAAVADFTPKEVSELKIKKQSQQSTLTLQLVETQDIAATLGKCKKENQLLIGFALETNDEMVHAQDKLRKKNFDYIVLNSLRDEGAGFGTDTNKVTIYSADGTKNDVPLQSKENVAQAILELATC